MGSTEIIRIDGIKWWMTESTTGIRIPVPLCPEHDLRLTPVVPQKYSTPYRKYIDDTTENAFELKCAEGPHVLSMPRLYKDERQYVIDRIDAKIFKNMQIIDLDGELTPIAKEKLTSKDNKYFVTSQLMDSKRGLQLVLYAGEKGKKEKTQIFIDPNHKKLTFDHKDLNPNDVFVEVRATFNDGSSHSINNSEVA